MSIALFTTVWSGRELRSAFWWLVSAFLGLASASQRMRHAALGLGPPDGSQREFCQWKQEGVSAMALKCVFTANLLAPALRFSCFGAKEEAVQEQCLRSCAEGGDSCSATYSSVLCLQ